MRKGVKRTKRKSRLIIVIFSTLLIFSSFDAVISSTDAEVQDQVVTFLVDVVGINEESISFSSFNVSRNYLVSSTIPNTGIIAILSISNQNFSLAMNIVYGKVHFYKLKWLESPEFDASISNEDALNLVTTSLKAYETKFGATYVKDLMAILPADLEPQDSRIENQYNVLETNYANESEEKPDYVTFSWSKKIDGFELWYGGLSINGVITSFSDSVELYKIVVADEYISEDQVLSIGKKYIKEYAEENNRKIVSIESKFNYVRDFNSKRGDTYTVYPQWTISAEFEDVSKEGIYGYAVLIWADTGEVHHNAEQGMFMPLDTESTPSTAYLIMAGIAIAIIILAIVIFS